MNDSIRLLDFGQVTYLDSQAYYHAVADGMTAETPDTIILVSPDRPHFSVGFHQDPRQELDLEFCRDHNYPVLRRRVGGGAIYLDSHQLFYQFVFHHLRAPAMVDSLYQYALAAPVETLVALGLDAQLRGVNEIVANGKRIAGTGAGRVGEASVVVGNFLFDFDYKVMAQAWHTPTENYRRLAREGLEKYVTTLRREMATPPSMPEVKELLVDKIRLTFGKTIEAGELTANEKVLASEAEQELSSTERLYEVEGEPRRSLKIADGVWMHHASCYLLIGGSEGKLNVSIRRRGSLIDAIVIEPESGFGGRIWDVVGSALVGLPMEHQRIQAPIERFVRAGLIPEEVNLDPLVKTIVKIGHDSK